MAAIVAAGAYIPIFRIPRDVIAQAWGRGSLGGERAAANADEDSLTMAVEAATDCLAGVHRQQVVALYFASTTAPYREKQIASLVAAASDLPKNIQTADFANSLRAGANALRAALQAVQSGAVRSVLVVAADARVGYPRSDQEQAFGDAAAAILVSAEGVGATVESSFSWAEPTMDVWRKDSDTYVQTWEDRWVTTEAWTPTVNRALKAVLEIAQVNAKDLHRLVLSGGTAAAQTRFVKGLGISAEQFPEVFSNAIGDAGAAQALLGLSSALQSAQPGSRIAVVAYGDGADALVFKVGAERPYAGRRGASGFLASKLALSSYQRFLSARNLVDIVPGEPFRLMPSATATWRDEANILRCHASRCRQCGTVAYPIQRICVNCRSKDEFEEVRLSDQRATVFTYSIDNLAGRGDDPVVVQTVAEMEESKARFYGLMTDCDPKQVHVGMPVELTFRRMYEGAGFYNYFWKCRPVRGS